MWKKASVTAIAGSDSNQQGVTRDDRVFQIVYGKISRIALRVLSDRVKRTLMLYDPRSGNADNFVRLRLPDGKLPGDDFLEEQMDGVLMQWAREDADCYLDCLPPRHSLEGDDPGVGLPMQVRAPSPAPHPQQQMAGGQPQASPPPQQPVMPEQPTAPAAPQAAPQQESTPQDQSRWEKAPEEQPANPQNTAPPVDRPPKPKAKEIVRGTVKFVGVREHSFRNNSFTCYTVDILTSSGITETFRGSHLEDRMKEINGSFGDTVEIAKVGKRGRKNLFYVEKLN